jgi:hypothetical protein
MVSQGIHPDIFDSYLVGVGSGQWPYWNSPAGAFITVAAGQAESVGAVPMFTLYQMATNGDGNISDITDVGFMTGYWSQAKLMYQVLGSYGKPALVNLEPDFWGYVEKAASSAPGGNPADLPAVVTVEPECANLPNTAAGIAQCLLTLGRMYAPNVKIGFPPSLWSNQPENTGNYMIALGAAKADFSVAETSDRDAGCMEVSSPPSECSGRVGPFYWDELNQTSPNFVENQDEYQTVAAMLNLPILYWQTPLGVPSSTPGGYNQHYRDDHVDYMLKNPKQYTAINTFAIVFGAGAGSQTNISTDGGEFATLFQLYLNDPAPLP